MLELVVALAIAFSGGTSITVHCLPEAVYARETASLGIPGVWAYSLIGSREITLQEASCERVEGALRTRRFLPRHYGLATWDLLTVGHEVAHSLGQLDEHQATCYSLGSMVRALRKVGFSKTSAKATRDFAKVLSDRSTMVNCGSS